MSNENEQIPLLFWMLDECLGATVPSYMEEPSAHALTVINHSLVDHMTGLGRIASILHRSTSSACLHVVEIGNL